MFQISRSFSWLHKLMIALIRALTFCSTLILWTGCETKLTDRNTRWRVRQGCERKTTHTSKCLDLSKRLQLQFCYYLALATTSMLRKVRCDRRETPVSINRSLDGGTNLGWKMTRFVRQKIFLGGAKCNRLSFETSPAIWNSRRPINAGFSCNLDSGSLFLGWGRTYRMNGTTL